MLIQNYVKKNFEKLPKSTFNGEELVTVLILKNEDWGYGHHMFEGVAIDKDGKVFWCYSSGCSCDGSCSTEHKADLKKFETEGFDLSKIDGKNLNFVGLRVDFQDYG
jgi:hypothetical protein